MAQKVPNMLRTGHLDPWFWPAWLFVIVVAIGLAVIF